MALRLRWKNATRLPVDADVVRPDQLARLSMEEMARLECPNGNQRSVLGDLFEMEGSASDDQTVVVEGEMPSVRGLGAGMESGRLIVQGRVGMRLGAEMTGGEIALEGAAGSWAGASMAGGRIEIRGEAGDYLGGPLPGHRKGMRDGLILVMGRVGDLAGLAMRRGLIAVRGEAGDGLGQGLIAGSIFVFGRAGRPVGASMKRGSIVLLDPEGRTAEPMATFQKAGEVQPVWLSVYLRRLMALGFPVPATAMDADWIRFQGDGVVNGKGEVLLPL